jgi:hypothetical protein
MWFSNSKKYINPSLVCLGVHSFTHSLFIVHCSHISLCSLSLNFFTHSSFLNHFDLGLGKKNKLLEMSHGFVGGNDCWCIPAMN